MRFAGLLVAIALAPLLCGVINRTKAWLAGRRGPPLLQTYYDLAKLAGKGAVYSHTTSWLFRAGPIVSLACVLTAATMVPLGSLPAVISFPGDLILLAYLLALGRFFTVCAALDTGSSFEGMGASREVFFAMLADPPLLLGLAALTGLGAGEPLVSLTQIHHRITPSLWMESHVVLVLVGIALGIVYLAENCRIPVDDPNTHLELTMIHEVMVLDHSGPDLAYIVYAAALKLWVLGAMLVALVLPSTGWAALDLIVALAGILGIGVLVGVMESTMARMRLVRVPQLLIGATALVILALVLEYHLG